MKDQLIKALAFDNSVRVYVASTTNLVNEIQERFNLWPTALAALGRSLTATAMVCSFLKGEETLAITIDGNGPIGKIITGGNAYGEIKGYVQNPEVHFQYNSGKLNVGMAVGTDGFLTVTKDLGMGNIFTSQVELQTGEIGDDFTYYFAKSEQIPTAIGLGVLVSTETKALASGGFIIQILPGCKDEIIDKIEHIVKTFPNVSDVLNQIDDLHVLLKMLTEGQYEELSTLDLSYKCGCSKERFKKGLMTLKKEDVVKMLEEDGEINASCHFCNQTYRFTKEDFKDYFK